MPLEFKVGRRESVWKRLWDKAWIMMIPAGALLFFVIFLGINRIGNTFPAPEERATAHALPPPMDSVFAGEPELYRTAWPLDTEAHRQWVAAATEAIKEVPPGKEEGVEDETTPESDQESVVTPASAVLEKPAKKSIE